MWLKRNWGSQIFLLPLNSCRPLFYELIQKSDDTSTRLGLNLHMVHGTDGPDCKVWSARGTRSPRNNFWLVFRLRKISAKANFCADFPTSLVRSPRSFQKEACQFCFCAERSRCNTLLVALLFDCKPLMEQMERWQDNARDSRWARGVRLQRSSRLFVLRYLPYQKSAHKYFAIEFFLRNYSQLKPAFSAQ